MPIKHSIPILFFAFTAWSQMPSTGEFFYKLSPREARVGQPVTFEAFEFNMCLYSYDVSYELLPTPISSKKTMIININAKRKPSCATAAGYSGPKINFENLGIGVYLLKFDSTSDFKKDLGDTNQFEITSSLKLASEINPKNRTHKSDHFRVDGKILKNKKVKEI